MLNVAKIVRVSDNGKFDTVVFFDKDEESVNATYINIPGSLGFPADFTKLVLTEDPDEDGPLNRALSSDTSDRDTDVVREKKRLIQQRRMFIREFPFDIINLDLEEFLLKPNDEFPGRILRSFMKILEWQRKPFQADGKTIDEFALMYTAQIGPRDLTGEYQNLLEGAISDNIQTHPDLERELHSRTGYREPRTLRERDFDEFFRIAVPKLLAAYVRREDWFIDPSPGVTVFEFDRPSASGGYKMLHFVMHVKRQDPPAVRRRPLQDADGIPEAYAAVAQQVFTQREISVSPERIDTVLLMAHLNRIFARRRKYASGRTV